MLNKLKAISEIFIVHLSVLPTVDIFKTEKKVNK